MKLFEAIERYNEDKNEIALYYNTVRAGISYNEIIDVLKDTLGNKFNKSTLCKTMGDLLIEITSNGESIEATDREFE